MSIKSAESVSSDASTVLTQASQFKPEVAEDGVGGAQERDRATAPQVLIIDSSREWVNSFHDSIGRIAPSANCTRLVSVNIDECLQVLETQAWDLVFLPYLGVFSDISSRQRLKRVLTQLQFPLTKIIFATSVNTVHETDCRLVQSDGFNLIDKRTVNPSDVKNLIKQLLREDEIVDVDSQGAGQTHVAPAVAESEVGGVTEKERATTPQVLIIDGERVWVNIYQSVVQNALPRANCETYVLHDKTECLALLESKPWDLVILPYLEVFETPIERQSVARWAKQHGRPLSRVIIASGAFNNSPYRKSEVLDEGFGIIDKQNFSSREFPKQIQGLFEVDVI